MIPYTKRGPTAFGREKDGCNKRYAHWRYIGCSTVHRSVFPGDGDALLRLSLIHIYKMMIEKHRFVIVFNFLLCYDGHINEEEKIYVYKKIFC